jgi:hypothetical protein
VSQPLPLSLPSLNKDDMDCKFIAETKGPAVLSQSHLIIHCVYILFKNFNFLPYLTMVWDVTGTNYVRHFFKEKLELLMKKRTKRKIFLLFGQLYCFTAGQLYCFTAEKELEMILEGVGNEIGR